MEGVSYVFYYSCQNVRGKLVCLALQSYNLLADDTL